MVGQSANCASRLEKWEIFVWGRQHWHCALTSLLPHRFHSSFLAGQSSNWVLQIWRMKIKLGTLIKVVYFKTWTLYGNELIISKLGFNSVDQLAHQALWFTIEATFGSIKLQATNRWPGIEIITHPLTHFDICMTATQWHNAQPHSHIYFMNLDTCPSRDWSSNLAKAWLTSASLFIRTRAEIGGCFKSY